MSNRTGTEPASDTNKEPAKGTWVLAIRTPLVRQRNANGELYEWNLTLVAPRERACRIDGIWFLASAIRTLEASEVIERMRRETELGKAELQALIEDHRLGSSAVRLIRSIGRSQWHEQHQSAHDPAFGAALTWGGIESA